MDYKVFYDDVVNWINKANQEAMRHGLNSEIFWAWVTSSSGEICAKYQDNRLVVKQMMMLCEWLEEVYESQKSGKVTHS